LGTRSGPKAAGLPSQPTRCRLSCGFFGYKRAGGVGLRRKICDLHFLPVIDKLAATVQADHVGPRPRHSSTASIGSHRDRKAIAGMPAPEHRIHNLRKHRITPNKNVKIARQFRPRNNCACLLRFVSYGKGSGRYLCGVSIRKFRQGLLRDSGSRSLDCRLARRMRETGPKEEANRLEIREEAQSFCGPDFLCAVHLLMMAA